MGHPVQLVCQERREHKDPLDLPAPLVLTVKKVNLVMTEMMEKMETKENL